MKLIVLRIEDVAPARAGLVSLLEGARTGQLLHLCQAGSAGALQLNYSGLGLDRAQIHRGLIGLKANDGEAQPGRWYAAAANASVEPDETVWCCDFVTQQEGRVVDAAGGKLSTKEGQVLLQALDEQLGSDARRWDVGEGHRHLFIVKSAAFGGKAPMVGGPETVLNEEWRRALPRGAVGDALHALLEQAAAVLDAHPVNRVRVDLGENPANGLWLWGASGEIAPESRAQQHGPKGVMLTNAFLLRGLARVRGFGCRSIPTALDEAGCQSLAGEIIASVDQNQPVVYAHLRVSSVDPVERQCAMERIDQLVIKPVTERVGREPQSRFLAVIDSRSKGLVPFVAIGGGMARQPVPNLSLESFQASPLGFTDSADLMGWLSQTGKSK